MQVVDSNKQKLTTPEIVIQTMESKTDTKNDLVNAMRLLAKEGSMENADTVQIGNTVFLAHRGKDKNKNKNKQQESTSASIGGQGGGQIIGNKYIPKA